MKQMLEERTLEIEAHMKEMIPPHMHRAVMDWLWKGWPPGGFLTAVLCNDLKGAGLNADSLNAASLADYVKFFTWYMPMDCWGNEQSVREWAKQGGWSGMLDEESA